MAASKNTKRRLRPASKETLRERTDKAQQQTAKQQVQSGKRSGRVQPFWRPFRKVGRTLRWVGRHIIPRYFRNSFKELRDVTWPGRKETRQLTTAVIMFAIIFAALIAILDLGLDKVFKRILLK